MWVRFGKIFVEEAGDMQVVKSTSCSNKHLTTNYQNNILRPPILSKDPSLLLSFLSDFIPQAVVKRHRFWTAMPMSK